MELMTLATWPTEVSGTAGGPSEQAGAVHLLTRGVNPKI